MFPCVAEQTGGLHFDGLPPAVVEELCEFARARWEFSAHMAMRGAEAGAMGGVLGAPKRKRG
jgi:hypothetical protein